MRFWALGWILIAQVSIASEVDTIRVYPGFVTKLRCEGRLLVSALGNDREIRLEALPKELGCGVLLKPLSTTSIKTNLILETSAGTIQRLVFVTPGAAPRSSDLEIELKGESK